MNTKRTLVSTLVLALPLSALSACSEYRENDTKISHTQEHAGKPDSIKSSDAVASHSQDADREEIIPNDSRGTIDRFLTRDPSLKRFFDKSYAYVVFPKIGKGAVGIGGAAGTGDVYEQGKVVATSDMSQVTLGVQLGGQTYSEVVFFSDKPHFEVFKDGNFEFAASASAVAVEAGHGATNDFEKGVAVFTIPRGGLMFEAAIGGQKFTYKPIDKK